MKPEQRSTDREAIATERAEAAVGHATDNFTLLRGDEGTVIEAEIQLSSLRVIFIQVPLGYHKTQRRNPYPSLTPSSSSITIAHAPLPNTELTPSLSSPDQPL